MNLKNIFIYIITAFSLTAIASCDDEPVSNPQPVRFNHIDTLISAEPHVFYLELSYAYDGKPANWERYSCNEWHPIMSEWDPSTYHDGDPFDPSNPPGSWNEGVLPAWVKIEEGLIEGRDFLKVSIDRNSDNALRGICIVCASNNNADYTSGRINIFQKPMPDQASFRRSDTQFLQ